MVETPVPQSDVPGEKTSPTQPIPMDAHGKPFAYARPFIRDPDDIIDFTPALRAEALENLKRYRVENSPYVPLILGDVNGKLGSLNIGNTAGGTNWPGGGLDPETHVFYSQASMSSVTTGSLTEPPPGFSDIRYVAGVKGREFREMEGPGFGSAADAPQRGGRAGGAGGTAAETGRGGPGGAAPAAGGPGAPGGRGGGGFGGPGPQGLSVVKPPY